MAQGALVVPSVEAALAAARKDAEARGADEIMVIGGSDIFLAAMPVADRLEITHVHASARRRRQISAHRSDGMAGGFVRRHPGGPDDSADFTVATLERIR